MGCTEMGNASASATSAPSVTAATSAAPVAAAATTAPSVTTAATTAPAAPMTGEGRSRRAERHRDCAKAYGQAQDGKVSVNQPHDAFSPNSFNSNSFAHGQ